MKFSLFFLSALPLAAFAAPVPSKRDLDFAQSTVASLMSTVQPMITDLENVLATAEGAAGGDLASITATAEQDFEKITSTLVSVTAEVTSYTGPLCTSGNIVAATLQELVNELNSVISTAESKLGEDNITASIQPLESALTSLISGLVCIVVDLLSLVQSFIDVMPGDVATAVNGLVSSVSSFF